MKSKNDCNSNVPVPPQVLDVWPGKPAADDGATIGEEKWLDPRPGDKWKKWVTNVTRPTLTIYRPPPLTLPSPQGGEGGVRGGGAAALVCPGGGYHALMWDLEGEEPAAWLNSLGVTGIILKYRCPRRPGEDLKVPAPGPLKDAQRAISLVRSKAAEWDLDPQRIGMIGFSAGAHLVAAAATNFAHRSYEPIDEIDRVSCRPDFGILAYSGYSYLAAEQRLSPTLRVVPGVPPLFLAHGSEDSQKGSEIECSVLFFLALRRAGNSCELHVYARGEHGFGVRQDGNPCAGWTKDCADWLNRCGLLNANRR